MKTFVVSFVFPPSPGRQTQGPAMVIRGCAALLQSRAVWLLLLLRRGFSVHHVCPGTHSVLLLLFSRGFSVYHVCPGTRSTFCQHTMKMIFKACLLP